jgi:hypothetical protein
MRKRFACSNPPAAKLLVDGCPLITDYFIFAIPSPPGRGPGTDQFLISRHFGLLKINRRNPFFQRNLRRRLLAHICGQNLPVKFFPTYAKLFSL